MLYANIHIDLPSELVLRERTLLAWFSRLIGRELEPSEAQDVATITGLSVFKPVTDALAQVGVTDVLSVIVDDKIAYVDTNEDSGDLASAVAELDARAVLEREFEVMSMTLADRREGLRTLIEVTLRRRVPASTPELRLHFAGRLDAMQVARGDTPVSYAKRLRALAADTSALVAARERFTARVGEAERALAQQLGALSLSCAVTPVELRLIRPGPRQLDHFRRLTWGSRVRLPKYRPVPIRGRRGAYDEPFYHYYYDPYFDFVAWVTLSEIAAGRGWQGLDFEVLDPDGSRVFDSGDPSGEATLQLVHLDQVQLTQTGLVVDPAIPELGGPDPGEVGDPRVTAGFGGEHGLGHANAPAQSEASGGDAGGPDGGDFGGSCGASCGGCGSG
jgi:hypothetical protein